MDPVESWLWCGVMVASNQTTLWGSTNILWNNTEIRNADINILDKPRKSSCSTPVSRRDLRFRKDSIFLWPLTWRQTLQGILQHAASKLIAPMLT